MSRSLAPAVFILSAAVLVVVLFTSGKPRRPSDQADDLARDVLRQLVDVNTTDSVGSTTIAAEGMAKRLRESGFSHDDVVVLGPNERKENMVARLRGTGAHKPVLLLGHLDVVEARREDWTSDPFTLIEKDGYFYGRGTEDMKGEDAIFVTTLMRFKQEGYKPDRDIILALTADEEGGNFNGVDWLLKNHRELIDAEFVLNGDGGGVNTERGKPVSVSLDASEKLYADYELTVTNPGGHSSLPVPDNAIYHLADALARLQLYQFPFELNEVTRAYFERMTEVTTGQRAADMKAILKTPADPDAIARLSADPSENATVRTTCVATRLDAGHANNALPQTARANVNCRILPGHSRQEVLERLIRVVADPKITVQYVPSHNDSLEHALAEQSFPPAPLRADVMQCLETTSAQMWPGVPVIPTMATGASDAVYTTAAGLPTYAISGIAVDIDDVRAHGKDERIRVKSFYDGVAFRYRFLKALTSGSGSKPGPN